MERYITKSSNMNKRVISIIRSGRRLVSLTIGDKAYNNSLIIERESSLLYLTIC